MLTLTLVSVQGANYTVYLKHLEFLKNFKHLLKDSNVNIDVIFQAQPTFKLSFRATNSKINVAHLKSFCDVFVM